MEYEALHAVNGMFQKALLKWISTNTLYSAIADQPCPWLKVALAMEDEITLHGSFIHLVGDWSSYKGPATKSGHPATVLALIEEKATNLRLQRYEVDRKLFAITLHAEISVAPGRQQKGAVSTKREPLSWLVVNLFRDWVAAHLASLDNAEAATADDRETTTSSPERDTNDINHELATTCPGHQLGQSSCLTLAGFYRTLARADDSYLFAELVMELLSGFKLKESEVRAALKTLKGEAAKIVAPLVKSGLKYAEGGTLEYLTCVDVKDVKVDDVKDEVEEKGADGEEMEELDDRHLRRRSSGPHE